MQWHISGNDYIIPGTEWRIAVSQDCNTFWLSGPGFFCTLTPDSLHQALDQAIYIVEQRSSYDR